MATRVVVLDANGQRSQRILGLLRRRHLDATLARTVHAAREAVAEGNVAAALVARTEGAHPLEVCRQLLGSVQLPPAIVLVGEARLGDALEALRLGVADYVPEPATPRSVVAALDRVLDRRTFFEHLRRLKAREPVPGRKAPLLLGNSPVMQELRSRIERVAATDVTVLITGESGTGKELVARSIYEGSRRSGGPFLALNCAALPQQLVESELFGHARGAFTGAVSARRGLFLQANGGTLFLDEIGSMSLDTQAKLLRCLQEGTVRPLREAREIGFDARIIAATNVDLATRVAAGAFREDLFYRLNVATLEVPPLRERGDDILLLAQHFLHAFSVSPARNIIGMTPGAARALLSYEWPGNVRELVNRIGAAVADARYDHITEQDLSLPVTEADDVPPERPSLLAPLESIERRHISEVMSYVHGNKSKAARILGLDRKTLSRKLRSLGLASCTRGPSVVDEDAAHAPPHRSEIRREPAPPARDV